MKALKVCFLFALSFGSDAIARVPAGSRSEIKASFPIPPKPIRLIVTDVDGTLMDRAGTLFEPNSAAFRLAHWLGIQLAVATGRPKSSVLEVIGEEKLSKMGFTGNPGIYLNGAYVVNADGKVAYDAPLKPEVLQHVLRVFEEEGVLEHTVGVTEGGFVQYTEVKGPFKEVHKVHVEGDPVVIAKLRRRLEDELGSELGFAQSYSRAFEVMAPGFDKGTGLRQLAGGLGISLDEVLVLGNAHNDLPMFKEAGTAVAVDDAYDIVKEAADFITVPSTEGALFKVVSEVMRLGLYPGVPDLQGPPPGLPLQPSRGLNLPELSVTTPSPTASSTQSLRHSGSGDFLFYVEHLP